MYKLNEILNKDIWENFIIHSDFEFYSFLESWEWWEFQEISWKSIKRYWIYKSDWRKDHLVWVFLVIKVKAKRWNYYFIPHWPLIKWDFFEVFSAVLPDLQTFAELDWMSFIRINSALKNTMENRKAFRKLKFINAPMHEHAEDTHLLNLKLSEEELLQNIKKKDRYYINRAKKEWVTIRIDNKIDHIEKLIKMHQDHAKRENWKRKYSAFSTHFIKNLYKVFWNNINTISANYKWETESILMTIKFWKTCVYYIAASNIRHPKFSPNYLCQWAAITKAKADECSLYNFWWVSPDNNPKHPIAWVTKFKRKFGWFDYSLLHAQDIVLWPKYYLNWLIETFRRKNRGYYYKKPE